MARVLKIEQISQIMVVLWLLVFLLSILIDAVATWEGDKVLSGGFGALGNFNSISLRTFGVGFNLFDPGAVGFDPICCWVGCFDMGNWFLFAGALLGWNFRFFVTEPPFQRGPRIFLLTILIA